MKFESSKFQTVIAIICATLPSILCYPHYKDKIPNGHNVTNPYDTDGSNAIWRGVGHWSLEGGGPRNPFGLAFKENNYVWNAALCNKDSDGDGLSNGEELCDPECTWTEGRDPPACNNAQLPSHPGICEPETDPACIELNGDASPDNFECVDKNAQGIQTISLNVEPTNVPVKDTTYYCKLFELPHDKEYHVVAAEPRIESDVIHHIDVYACSQDELSAKNGWVVNKFSTGADCEGLASMYCGYMIGAWTVGYPGSCLHGGDYGFRIGGSKYQHALVEYHWNNPALASGLVDSSGLTLFYTDQLRANDLGTLQVGQLFLNIPPNSVKHREYAVCSKECTKRPKMAEPTCLKLISANIHMHLLGDSGSITIKKPTGSETIAVDATFDYNTPIEHVFYPEKLICPGDEVIVECNFTSKGSPHTNYVHYGEGTNEEMCVGYLTYFPNKPDAPYCTQIGEVNFCETDEEVIHGDTERGCDMMQFLLSEILYNITQEVARAPECQGQNCAEECLEYLKCTQYTRHSCLRHNDIRFTLIGYLAEGEDPNYRNLGSKMEECYYKDPSDSNACEAGNAGSIQMINNVIVFIMFVTAWMAATSEH